ncbi:tRNA synthetases class II-domain-containing protein [Cercophora newfieldiana]|uniref:tRNA synthetases class II-domain-containing protein n=1 Tax=Cercophora newfieldiana TaxID=92897 RepID=A0AA40CYZ1_9PEZI|nr:tRNA synthetases class II-domain-containing protein [Cercophora newfieldiana]
MAQSRVSLRRLCSSQALAFGGSHCRLPVQLRKTWPSLISASSASSASTVRLTHSGSSPGDAETAQQLLGQQLREEWSKYNQFPRASTAPDFKDGEKVTVHGFLVRRRVKSSKLVFADIQVDNGPAIQIVSQFQEPESPEHVTTQALRAIPLYSPVSVTGTVAKLYSTPETTSTPPPSAPFPSGLTRIDIDLVSIQPLNAFPKDIVMSEGVQFPPQARHLQIRFSEALRARLVARPRIGTEMRKTLDDLGFTEVETPILFKSTPEGAREFLVPTRRPGLAYALPQSPQQYKQILMSSGVRGYYQFARCFRDEDLRADRQPEFTQLDLEMSFATGEDVMRTVETIVSRLPAALNAQFSMVKRGDDVYPVPKHSLRSTDGDSEELRWPELSPPFLRLPYQEAMTRFGSDKPDLRIPFEIRRVDHILPAEFISKITHLKNPIVEAFKLRPECGEPFDAKIAVKFVDKLMQNLPAPLATNPDGAPAPLVFTTWRPLRGLSSLGYDGFANLTSGEAGLEDFEDLQDGDILVFQARENKPFSGGSTALGTFRNFIYQEAVANVLLPRNFDFKFLWVTDFPMFTPNNETDPGQGGQAGFSATHHPFTAPLTDEDVELLATDPLRAKADHYDLVVNGVELGGGSRRIHLAKMQEYIMREILKMTDQGVGQFSHLLEALRAGCPPHAGFALGFDRLVAVFTHTDSVRDVIAFPKSMKGEDLTVKSPGKITSEQLATYHLAFPKKGLLSSILAPKAEDSQA